MNFPQTELGFRDFRGPFLEVVKRWTYNLTPTWFPVALGTM